MSNTMAEVLAEHQRKTGLRDLQRHCYCGWAGEPTGNAFIEHQAAALSAAGFGLVADTKADRGWLAKSRNTDGSVVIIGHFKTEAEAEKWAGKYPSSFVEAAS